MHCSCFLVIDLYFLITADTAQILNPIAELPIPLGKPINKERQKLKRSRSNFLKLFIY